MSTDRFSEYRSQDLDVTFEEVWSRIEKESEAGDMKHDLSGSDWPRVCPTCKCPARLCACLMGD